MEHQTQVVRPEQHAQIVCRFFVFSLYLSGEGSNSAVTYLDIHFRFMRLSREKCVGDFLGARSTGCYSAHITTKHIGRLLVVARSIASLAKEKTEKAIIMIKPCWYLARKDRHAQL